MLAVVHDITMKSHPFKASFILTMILALIAAGIASAHSDLVRSDPAANATLDTVPQQITLTFTEAIEPSFSTITVLFEDGTTVDGGNSTVSPTNPLQLTVSLKDSRQGTYVVSWRVLSAVDGHITSGAFVFSVGKPIDLTKVSGSSQSEGSVTSPIDMLARALTFIGQAIVAGIVAFRWLIWRPALTAAQLDGHNADENAPPAPESSVDDRAIKRGERLVFVGLGLAALGAIITLFVQSSLSNASIPAWLGTRVGRVWIGRVATLIAIGVMADDVAASGRRKWLSSLAVIWLSGQLLLLTTLTSHSAAVLDPPVIPFAADFIHLIATSIWVGGLVQLAFVVPIVAKPLADEDRAWFWLEIVVHFSTVAAMSLGVIIITGVYMSLLNVGSWPALISTVYGEALLFKLALAGAAMLIGAYNLIVVKPKLDAAIDAPETAPALHRRFRRVVTLEAIAGLLVLAAAGILTDLPRSKDPQPVATAGPLQLTTQADTLDVALTIDPARSGSSNFIVRASDKGQPVTDASDVSLRFTFLGRGLGTTKATAVATQDGAYTANGAYLSLPGEWQIEVALRRPNAFDAFAAYRVEVGLDGGIVIAGQESVIEAIVRWLSLYGLMFGGIVAIGMSVIWFMIGWKAARNPASLAVLLIPSIVALPIGVYSVVTFSREATPGLTLTNPFLPDEQSLAAGQKLFEANCAVCHGTQGRADGPAAANLTVRPPDFGNGHLDIHTDGDIFYWIQNGFGGSSPMPTFKGKLSDDDTWNLVNYVRRLRNLAGGQADQMPMTSQPTPTIVRPPAVLQPYTPPSFIAQHEITRTAATTPTGDADALQLLAQSDAAMNALTALVEDQSVSDDAGDRLQVHFDFNAPDRMKYQIANGVTSIEIGVDDYQQKPDGTWIKNQRGAPFKWPQFFYGKVAQDAQIEQTDQLNGRRVPIVLFHYTGFDFRLWIDPDSGRILQYTLAGQGEHVSSTYSAFDSAPPIEAPEN
jgi:copper transport protein